MQFVSVQEPNQIPEEGVVRLPGGYVARQITIITKENENFPDEQRAMANHLDFDWIPKGIPSWQASTPFGQRCPAVWVDSFVFFYTRGMAEPELLLGEWKKDVKVYGNKQTVHGLVVGAGGHYEVR
jgi:hypothetical protein